MNPFASPQLTAPPDIGRPYVHAVMNKRLAPKAAPVKRPRPRAKPAEKPIKEPPTRKSRALGRLYQAKTAYPEFGRAIQIAIDTINDGGQLTKTETELIVAWHQLGVPLREIAVRMQRSDDTIRKALDRAIK